MRERIEEYFRKNFDVEPKRPSDHALRRWREAVSVVKNPRRRFSMVADLAKRAEDDKKRKKLQEKIRVALYVQKAALQFIDAGKEVGYSLSKEVRDSGFGISPDELASFVLSHDTKGLEAHGGVEGLAGDISISLKEGVVSSKIPVRQNIYGLNRFVEKPSKGFWMFVWEAIQDLTLIILMVSAVVSIGVGIATEGWPKGMYDVLGIIFSIFLVVMVTAISDYKQSLQFKELDKEKKDIKIQVTRDGRRQKVSIYDLVVGDIVHLSIGDQVPADGLFISGHSLQIDESRLSGESEPVDINQERPFILAGTKVQDGSGKMLITSVGMRTEWGRLMDTLSEGGDNETPLQVKLNEVATIIGRIGLAFARLTFLVLATRFFVNKGMDHRMTDWSMKDASELLNYFCTAVIIIVVAVPERLPLAVTLSLAFAMKKLMSDKAHVRHLSACETMGSANCICTDKTGTLTTNHMVANKIWICDEAKTITSAQNKDVLKSVSEKVYNLLLQSIFLNTLRALALATEPRHDGRMRRPPVGRNVKFITGIMWRNIIGQSIYQIAFLLVLNFFGIRLLKLTGPDASSTFKTFFIFNCFVFCQVFNEINSRDMEKINMFRGMFISNTFMMVMICTVVFQIVIIEFLGTFAQTVPLSWKLWLASVLIGTVSLLVAVVLKGIPVSIRKQAARDHDNIHEPLLRGPELA